MVICCTTMFGVEASVVIVGFVFAIVYVFWGDCERATARVARTIN